MKITRISAYQVNLPLHEGSYTKARHHRSRASETGGGWMRRLGRTDTARAASHEALDAGAIIALDADGSVDADPPAPCQSSMERAVHVANAIEVI
jgi:hypothetical protein